MMLATALIIIAFIILVILSTNWQYTQEWLQNLTKLVQPRLTTKHPYLIQNITANQTTTTQ